MSFQAHLLHCSIACICCQLRFLGCQSTTEVVDGDRYGASENTMHFRVLSTQPPNNTTFFKRFLFPSYLSLCHPFLGLLRWSSSSDSLHQLMRRAQSSAHCRLCPGKGGLQSHQSSFENISSLCRLLHVECPRIGILRKAKFLLICNSILTNVPTAARTNDAHGFSIVMLFSYPTLPPLDH